MDLFLWGTANNDIPGIALFTTQNVVNWASDYYYIVGGNGLRTVNCEK